MTVGELKQGEYAITQSGLAVLALSPRSFKPLNEKDANVVHIANGMGAFSQSDLCTPTTRAYAFEVAAKYSY